jgi:hypothetical protein
MIVSHPSGRLGRLLYCLISALAVIALPLRAAEPNKTIVADTIYRADGTSAKGTLLISWPAFSTADGKPVAAGTLSVKIAANGSINLPLIPTQGATPSGTAYKVVIALEDGSSSTEYWSVPALSPTTIAAIRATQVPATVAMQVVSRDYVDSQLATAVRKNGDETISGSKTFEVSPLVPPPGTDAAAANKGYVDVAIAAAATGGTSVLNINKGGTGTSAFTAARCVRVADDGNSLESAPSDCGGGAVGSDADTVDGVHGSQLQPAMPNAATLALIGTPSIPGSLARYNGTSIGWSPTLSLGSATMYAPDGTNIGNTVVDASTNVEGHSVSAYQVSTGDYAIPNVFRLGLNPSFDSTLNQMGVSEEGWTFASNTKNFSGQQVGSYGSWSHFGSGSVNAIYGGAFEAFNAGSGNATVVYGSNGNAYCGGVAAGWPVQTATNNGNCTNLRGVNGRAANISTGTVTTAVGLYAGTSQNTGGGAITTSVGVDVGDQTAGATNYAIRTGLGKIYFGDAAQFHGSARFDSTIGIGTAPVTSTVLLLNNQGTTTGAYQTGVQIAPKASTAATSAAYALAARMDVAAGITQGTNVLCNRSAREQRPQRVPRHH